MQRAFVKKLALSMAVVLSGTAFFSPLPAGRVQAAGENAIVWDFEDGTSNGFTIVEGEFGDWISDIPYDHNSASATAYPRQGDWHLTTLETKTTFPDGSPSLNKYPKEDWDNITQPSDAFTGVIRSPIFTLEGPEMDFLVGGGNNPAVYVALCDIYGRELMKAQNTPPGETMIRIHWDVREYDPELVGQKVFIKIVDKADSAWGHITFDDFHAVGTVDPDAEILPEPPPEIVWSFEDGVLSPFKVTEGAFGETPVVAGQFSRQDEPLNKDGNWHLSTVETDGTADFDESFTGAIQSPKFKIMDPVITMKLAGGANPANYVAVIRASDGEELARAGVPKDGNTFQDVTIDLKEKYSKNEIVYLRIVDGMDQPGYGYIAVDDVRVKGETVYDVGEYSDVVWSFEDGTIAPFTTNDTFGKLVVDRDTDRNDNVTPMNKDGKWYLSTVELENGSYDEAFQGSITSPVFFLNPDNPSVTLRISGGSNPANYVALCSAATGEELKKVSAPDNGHPFNQVTLTLSAYTEGDGVYLKIVDGTTSNWGFIQVDDIRFSGAVRAYSYDNVRWSFEDGTLLPFSTADTFGKPVTSWEVDFNDKTTPVEKHGKYYLNTVCIEDTENYDESFTGTIRSPSFSLDPESPVIRLKLAGGTANYVAVRRASDNSEIARVAPEANGHVLVEREIDLTGKVTEGEQIYLAVVDTGTSGWAFIAVDDIRARVAFQEETYLQNAEQVTSITGWDNKRFASLKAMLQDLTDTFGEEYPNGPAYMEQVDVMQTRNTNFWKLGETKPSDPALAQFKEEMDALEREMIISNPLLTQAPILFVTRNQYAGDHHNTHNMFPDSEGEINQGYYQGGGAVKVIDFANGGTVTTLKEDTDGVFRDPEVSYEADRLLVSYRTQTADSYNIYEYTLSEDKTSIVEEKQLTSMRTADDMDPLYLPSGQIVFASTRDPKYVMCNRHISSNLYRMEADGANIIKITNSTLFERPTDVLPDGRILYDRWEYNDRDFGSAQGLWTVGPDGTQQVTYYGNNSPTGATIDAKAIPGTDMVIATLSSTHDRSWGALGIIDRTAGVDGQAPVVRTWPESARNIIGDPNKAGNNIDAYVGINPKYEDPQPLNDTYFLASRQIPGKGEKMGIYLLDTFGNETLLYEDDSSLGAYDATVLAPREREIAMSERRNYNDDAGTFFVQDVYEGTHMQGVERGTVKTLRIVESMDKKFISQWQQWGGEGQQNPGVNWHSFEVKRVIGEVPVYEDGSAYFEVPQDVFVYFQLLDEDGRMIQSMRSGTLVQSGEQVGCVGCHEDRRTTPLVNNDRKTPMALEANVEIVPNPDYTEGSDLPKTIVKNVPDKPQKRTLDFETRTDSLADYDDETLYPEYTDLPSMNFLTEVQPIFTANCLECHGYDDPAADLTLVPDKSTIFNASYIDLWRNRGKQGVRFGNMLGAIGGGDASFTTAKTWGSYASPLVKKIYEDPAHAARLTDAEKRRIAEWVDLNATYYGDYATNYGFNPGGRSPLTQAELNQTGTNWNLSWGETRPAQIYFDNPEKSPILKNYEKGSAQYNQALAAIQLGLERLRQNPDIDWRGLDAVPGNPELSIQPWAYCALDAWRMEKVEMRHNIEAANRAAIANGEKRYDSDNTPAWPDGFPGWPTEDNPGWAN